MNRKPLVSWQFQVKAETWIDSVPDADIRALADDGDYLWVITNVGITKLHKATGDISFYVNKIPGLEEFHLTYIALTDKGHIWVGTDGGGAGLYDGSSWSIYNFENGNLPNNTINAITSDTSGNFWFGTNFGLSVFDGENWTGYIKENSDLPNNIIKALACDEKGTVWIGTEMGCAQFDGKSFSVFKTSNSELPDDIVNALAFDSKGNTLMGTKGGLASFDGDTWTVYNTTNSSLSSNIVSSISVGLNDTIYLGVGANKYNYSFATFDGDSWSVFKTDNSGLLSNNVQVLVSDDQGNTWIGTDTGLMLFDGENWEIANTGMIAGIGTWSQKSIMPTHAHAITSSVVNGKIYVFGGYSKGIFYGVTNEYNPVTDSWASKSDMPTERSFLSTSVLNGKIYAIGGWPNPVSAVEEYDPETDTWKRLLDMPTSRAAHTTAAVNGMLYVIGGTTANTFNSSATSEGIGTVDVFDPGLSSPTIVDNSTPTVFNLLHNYPNPFNPSTTIEYLLPEEIHVKLTVYNISGQKVSVLTNNIEPAGRYSVIWDAGNMPNGIYFFMLQAGEFAETKKMLLLK